MDNFNKLFYCENFVKYGISARGVHWISKQTQYKRFEIIDSFIPLNENTSIIDMGCGYGEYLNFLFEKKIPNLNYLGLDCEDFMINISKKLYPKNEFKLCNMLKDNIPEADYIFCSGSLNLFDTKNFYKAIERCFNSAKEGFIFNFLTLDSIHKQKSKTIYNFCKKFCDDILVKDDYLINDATFFLKK